MRVDYFEIIRHRVLQAFLGVRVISIFRELLSNKKIHALKTDEIWDLSYACQFDDTSLMNATVAEGCRIYVSNTNRAASQDQRARILEDGAAVGALLGWLVGCVDG
jgi:hypothetical protein